MSGTAIAPVKVLSVPREKLSHNGRDTLLAALEEEMGVRIHKHPGVDGAFCIDDVSAKPLKEQGLVLIISKDG
jgi:hypothetical protein